MSAHVATRPTFLPGRRTTDTDNSTAPMSLRMRWADADSIANEDMRRSSAAPHSELVLASASKELLEFASTQSGSLRDHIGRISLGSTITLNPRVRDEIDAWIDSTAFTSSIDEIRRDLHFGTLKRLGWLVVPELLATIAAGHARWQCAELLSEITGEDPVDDGDLGDSDRIGKAWTEWGRSKSLL